jgi:hypothetical protein
VIRRRFAQGLTRASVWCDKEYNRLVGIGVASGQSVRTLAGAVRSRAHKLYWVLTHPVNNFWLKDADLKGIGESFIAFSAGSRVASAKWSTLRHVVRAVLVVFALVLLAVAATLRANSEFGWLQPCDLATLRFSNSGELQWDHH